MGRTPSIALRTAVMLIFLRNGNQYLNTSRIGRRVNKLGAVSLRKKDIVATSVSSDHIRRVCEGLQRSGYLETRALKPPRYEENSAHYRLCEESQEGIRKVARFLLKTAPESLLDSGYGKYAIETMAVPLVEGALDCRLSKTEAERVVSICLRSPEAFLRILDDNLESALVQIADRLCCGVLNYQTALRYLEAASIIGCADRRILRTKASDSEEVDTGGV